MALDALAQLHRTREEEIWAPDFDDLAKEPKESPLAQLQETTGDADPNFAKAQFIMGKPEVSYKPVSPYIGDWSSLPEGERIAIPVWEPSFDLLKGVYAGMEDQVEASMKMLKALFSSEPVFEQPEQISFAEQVGRGVGSTLTPFAATLAGTGLGAGIGAGIGAVTASAPGAAAGAVIGSRVGSAAGIGMMYLSEAWDAYQRELQRQKEEGEPIDLAKAKIKALGYGLASTAIEYAGMRIPGLRGVTDKAARSIGLGDRAANRVARYIEDAITEGAGEETLQQLAQNLIVGTPLHEGLVEAGAVGTLSSALALPIMGGIRRTLRMVKPSQFERAMHAAGFNRLAAMEAQDRLAAYENAASKAADILATARSEGDIVGLLTEENKRRIDRGEKPILYDHSTGDVDAALLALDVWHGYTSSGSRPIPQQRDFLEQLTTLYARLAFNEELAGEQGADKVKQLYEALRRQYEGQDIETGAVPVEQGQPAVQGAERTPETGVEVGRGAGRQRQVPKIPKIQIGRKRPLGALSDRPARRFFAGLRQKQPAEPAQPEAAAAPKAQQPEPSQAPPVTPARTVPTPTAPVAEAKAPPSQEILAEAQELQKTPATPSGPSQLSLGEAIAPEPVKIVPRKQQQAARLPQVEIPARPKDIPQNAKPLLDVARPVGAQKHQRAFEPVLKRLYAAIRLPTEDIKRDKYAERIDRLNKDPEEQKRKAQFFYRSISNQQEAEAFLSELNDAIEKYARILVAEDVNRDSFNKALNALEAVAERVATEHGLTNSPLFGQIHVRIRQAKQRWQAALRPAAGAAAAGENPRFRAWPWLEASIDLRQRLYRRFFGKLNELKAKQTLALEDVVQLETIFTAILMLETSARSNEPFADFAHKEPKDVQQAVEEASVIRGRPSGELTVGKSETMVWDHIQPSFSVGTTQDGKRVIQKAHLQIKWRRPKTKKVTTVSLPIGLMPVLSGMAAFRAAHADKYGIGDPTQLGKSPIFMLHRLLYTETRGEPRAVEEAQERVSALLGELHREIVDTWATNELAYTKFVGVDIRDGIFEPELYDLRHLGIVLKLSGAFWLGTPNVEEAQAGEIVLPVKKDQVAEEAGHEVEMLERHYEPHQLDKAVEKTKLVSWMMPSGDPARDWSQRFGSVGRILLHYGLRKRPIPADPTKVAVFPEIEWGELGTSQRQLVEDNIGKLLGNVAWPDPRDIALRQTVTLEAAPPAETLPQTAPVPRQRAPEPAAPAPQAEAQPRPEARPQAQPTEPREPSQPAVEAAPSMSAAAIGEQDTIAKRVAAIGGTIIHIPSNRVHAPLTVVSPQGKPESVTARVVWAVIPASQLDNLINEKLSDFQARLRTSIRSREEAVRLAGRLTPSALGASFAATHGAPVIDLYVRKPDGTEEIPGVIAGNLRSMAIVLASQMQNQAWREYEAFVRSFTRELGVSVDHIDKPVLVRVVTGYTTLDPNKSQYDAAVEFAMLSNAQTGSTMTLVEIASTAANVIRDLIAHNGIRFTESGELTSESANPLQGALERLQIAPMRLTGDVVDVAALERLVLSVLMFDALKNLSVTEPIQLTDIFNALIENESRRFVSVFLARVGPLGLAEKAAGVQESAVGQIMYGLHSIMKPGVLPPTSKPDLRREWIDNNLRRPLPSRTGMVQHPSSRYLARQFLYIALERRELVRPVLDRYIRSLQEAAKIKQTLREESAGSLFTAAMSELEKRNWLTDLENQLLEKANEIVRALYHGNTDLAFRHAVVTEARSAGIDPESVVVEPDGPPRVFHALAQVPDDRFWYDNDAMIAPRDAREFARHLRRLGGRWHVVADAIETAIEMGLLDLVPTLQFAFRAAYDTRYGAEYDPGTNVVTFYLAAMRNPELYTVHEVLHAIYETMPREMRRNLERIRQRMAMNEAMRLRQQGADETLVQQLLLIAGGFDVDPASIPVQYYHLTSASEFFVWALEQRAYREILRHARNRSEAGLWARIIQRARAFVRRMISFLEELHRRSSTGMQQEFKAEIDRLFTSIKEGTYSYIPQTQGTAAAGRRYGALAEAYTQHATAPTQRALHYAANVIPRTLEEGLRQAERAIEKIRVTSKAEKEIAFIINPQQARTAFRNVQTEFFRILNKAGMDPAARDRLLAEIAEPLASGVGYSRIYEQILSSLPQQARNDKQLMESIVAALRSMKLLTVTYTLTNYGVNIGNQVARRDALERELAAVQMLRTTGYLPRRDLDEILAGVEPEIPPLLMDLDEAEARIRDELALLDQEDERDRQLIEQYVAQLEESAQEDEKILGVNGLERAAAHLRAIGYDAATPSGADPASEIRRAAIDYMEGVADMRVLDRDLRQKVEYRSNQILLRDPYLRRFIDSTGSLHVTFADVMEAALMAAEALYGTSDVMSPRERVAVAAAFVTKVLAYVNAKAVAFEIYTLELQQLGKRLASVLGTLTSTEEADQVISGLIDIIKDGIATQQGQKITGAAVGSWAKSASEIAHNVAVFAASLSRHNITEQAWSDFIRELDGQKTPDQLRDLVHKLIVQSYQQRKKTPPPREKLNQMTGLNDEALAEVVMMMEALDTLRVAVRSLLFDTNVMPKVASSMLKQLSGLSEALSKASVADAPRIAGQMANLFEGINTYYGAQIETLRKELVRVYAQIRAIEKAKQIWDSIVTGVSIPDPNNAEASHPFWDMYHRAVELSGLSKLMIVPVAAGPVRSAIRFVGFTLPARPDLNRGEPVIIDDIAIENEDSLLDPKIKAAVDRWMDYAVQYIAETREAVSRYQQSVAAGTPEKSPEERGYNVEIANGLENALAIHGSYLRASLAEDPDSIQGANYLTDLFVRAKLINTIESMVNYAPATVRTALRTWMGRFMTARGRTHSVLARYSNRMARALREAMQSHNITNIETYRNLVWEPLARLGRQHGVTINVGDVLVPSGSLVTEQDLALLKLQQEFHLELLNAVETAEGLDPDGDLRRAMVGIHFIGPRGEYYARRAGSVGTYGLPRMPTDDAYNLAHELGLIIAQLTESPPPGQQNLKRELLRLILNNEIHDYWVSAFAELYQNGRFIRTAVPMRVASGETEVADALKQIFNVFISGPLGLDVLHTYIYDSSRDPSDIAIERSGEWINVLRRTARMMMSRMPAQAVIIGDILDMMVDAARAEVPALQEADDSAVAAYVMSNMMVDLYNYARVSVSALATRMPEITMAIGFTSGKTFWNQFHKPAGKLVLPSAVYSHGALTAGEMQMSANKAQAYTLVQFALAAARAYQAAKDRLEMLKQRIASLGTGNPDDLRRAQLVASALESLYKDLSTLATLAWQGHVMRDPTWFAFTKAELLSSPTVILRNAILGPILAYMHISNIHNVTGALALLQTLKAASRQWVNMAFELLATSRDVAKYGVRNFPKLLRALKRDWRTALEEYVARIAEDSVAATIDRVSRNSYYVQSVGYAEQAVQAAFAPLLFHNAVEERSYYSMPPHRRSWEHAKRLARLHTIAATKLLRLTGTEVADAYLNAIAFDALTRLEKELRIIATRYFYDHVEDLRQELRDGPRARSLTEKEAVRDIHVSTKSNVAAREEQLSALRELFQEAGYNFDLIVRSIALRMMEAAEAERPGEAPVLTQDIMETAFNSLWRSSQAEPNRELNDLQVALASALMRRFNAGDLINRPIAAALSQTVKVATTFFGYASNFLYQLARYVGGTADYPRTAPRYVSEPGEEPPVLGRKYGALTNHRIRRILGVAIDWDRLMLILGRLFWLAIIAELFGQISLFATNKLRKSLYGRWPGVYSIFEPEFYQSFSNASRSLMFGHIVAIPILGDIAAVTLNVVYGNRGWDLTNRVVFISAITDFVRAVTASVRQALTPSDANSLYGEIKGRLDRATLPVMDLMKRYMWHFGLAMAHVSEKEETYRILNNARSAIRNAATRTGFDVQMPRMERKTDVDYATRAAIRDYISAIRLNDTDEAASALAQLVQVYKNRGSADPNASVLSTIRTINPFNNLFGTRGPTTEEREQILANLTPQERAAYEEAASIYDRALQFASDRLSGSGRRVAVPALGGTRTQPPRARESAIVPMTRRAAGRPASVTNRISVRRGPQPVLRLSGAIRRMAAPRLAGGAGIRVPRGTSAGAGISQGARPSRRAKLGRIRPMKVQGPRMPKLRLARKTGRGRLRITPPRSLKKQQTKT